MTERVNRFFKNPDWIQRVKVSFEREGRDFIDLNLGTAIVPLVLEDIVLQSGDKVTAIRFAGSYISDYLDFKGRESANKEEIETLLGQASSLGADFIWLSNIPTYSRLYQNLKEISSRRDKRRAGFVECVPTFGTVCEKTFDDYLAHSVSKNTRRNIRRKNKKLDEKGAGFEVVQINQEGLERFMVNQHKRAGDKNLNSVLENEEVGKFLSLLPGVKDIHLANLAISGIPISQLILLVDGGAISIFMQSFDPDWAEFSPSFCNISRVIRHAHENELAYIDFLRGDENYKQHFANTKVEMVKFIAVTNPRLDPDQVFSFVKGYEE